MCNSCLTIFLLRNFRCDDPCFRLCHIITLSLLNQQKIICLKVICVQIERQLTSGWMALNTGASISVIWPWRRQIKHLLELLCSNVITETKYDFSPCMWNTYVVQLTNISLQKCKNPQKKAVLPLLIAQ